MALFNLLAKHRGDMVWSKIHSTVKPTQFNFLSIFPIPKYTSTYADCIGITVSSKYNGELTSIKDELLSLLATLINEGFTVKELYNGQSVTMENYSAVLNYL